MASLTAKPTSSTASGFSSTSNHSVNVECLHCSSDYWKTRDRNDAQKAVNVDRDALQSIEAGDPKRAQALGRLSASLEKLFYHTSDVNLIEEALICEKKASAYFNHGIPAWQKSRNRIGTLLFNRSNHSRTTRTIDESIEFLQETMNIGCFDKRYFPGTVSRLAVTLLVKYRVTGSIEYLTRAVEAGHKSISCVSYDSDNRFDNVSIIMFEHYQATGQTTSLDEALETSQLAIDKLNGSSYEKDARAVAFRNRAAMFEAKAERSRESNGSLALQHLQNALDCGEDAIKCLSYDSPMAVSIFSIQASCMGSMAKLTGDHLWSERGINLLQDKAFCSNMKGSYDVDYSCLLSSLTQLYQIHSDVLRGNGNTSDSNETMEKGIDIGEQAISKTPANDSRLGDRCKNVATMLISKFDRTNDPKVLERAKQLYLIAAKTEAASLLVRLPASMHAAVILWKAGKTMEAHDLLQGAIKLLTASNIESASTDDLRQTLLEVSGLGSLAASVSIELGNPAFEALACIESAGCVVAGLSMDLRSEDSELQKQHPDLAQSYRELRARFSQASRQLSVPGNYRNARKLQESLLVEMNNAEKRIREEEGFGRFQLPLNSDQIQALGREGPVIVINVSQLRSDALIVKANGITVVPLPKVTPQALDKYVSWISGIGNPARRNIVPTRSPNAPVSTESALLWLWKSAVQPILQSIDTKSYKRVWWVTSGRAGRAPFHAAGDYYGETQGDMNTASHVVSSYISSLKALKFARGQNPQHSAGHQMMLVTMSKNPSPHQNLDTRYEEQAINSAFLSGRLLHLKHSDPDTVLSSLSEHSFVHFACHGASVNADPTKSGLLLVKDGCPAMLTIADLDAVNLKEGSIAYLSACSTAEQTDGKLASEAIHLANSFQALGFQHVIGTLWGADDRAAGQIAKGFYSRLASTLQKDVHEDGEPLDVAVALHEAVMEYRQECGQYSRISDWAPFIHIGV